MERTFFEKILSITRLSYEGSESLSKKIRHFYDIVKIYNKDKSILEHKNSEDIFRIALKDDSKNPTFSGEWLSYPLSSAPLYSDFQLIWGDLERSYVNDLKDLIWIDSMPSSDDVIRLVLNIKKFLISIETKSI